ncbi:MAG: hypothetical protein ACOC44_01260 [Promethearchaeia archaeon]
MERKIIGLDLSPTGDDIIHYDLLDMVNPFRRNCFDAFFVTLHTII